MTGTLRGKTLVEKQYGPGFRPVPLLSTVARFDGCGIEGCADPVYGSMELYVDDVPPMIDWYSKLLRSLEQNVYVRVAFCQGHLGEVVQRSVVEGFDEPDTWAPWRANPPVLSRPPQLLKPEPVEKPKLIVAR